MLIYLKPRPSGGRGFFSNHVDHLVRIVSAPARAFWTTDRGLADSCPVPRRAYYRPYYRGYRVARW
jgi:hypothetical protein